MTTLQPDIGAEKDKPQAFAWNIGTTGITTSVDFIPIASAELATNVCRTFDLWEYKTPLGFPVVPEV